MIELHVNDFSKAKSFYNQLDFQPVWERSPEGHKGYLVLKCEDNILCFWGGNKEIYTHEYFKKFPENTPTGYRVEIVLTLTQYKEIYNKLIYLNCIVEPLKMKPWGLEDFRLIDPFGFYIRITSPHNIESAQWAVK